jgi:hypothetical protein
LFKFGIFGRGGIGWREDLALDDSGVDLDLVEPRRVDRQVNRDQPRMGRLKTLDGGLAAMRAAVVEDPGDAPCQRCSMR